ncbi:MAG TPA: hypothetical protein VHA80_04710, partial [Solirubrobacterales bacterium]|nr:hypothetical protein [Solirubrobacterales bacterium]
GAAGDTTDAGQAFVVDSEPRSQPVAFPRTNRHGRTLPPTVGPTMTVTRSYGSAILAGLAVSDGIGA